MKLHTELFHLRRLLLAELEEAGCLPFRDLHSVEVDLTAGELIVALAGAEPIYHPLLNGFCGRHDLEIKSWSTEENLYTLGFKRREGLPDEVAPRCPQSPPPAGADRAATRRREYAAAVRLVFRSNPSGGVFLHTGRVAWAMGRPDLAARWFAYAAGSETSREVRLDALVWQGVACHAQAGTLDRKLIGRACRCYRRALALEGGHFLALLNLGKLCLLLGWSRRAGRFLRRALRRRPRDREIPYLLSLLD